MKDVPENELFSAYLDGELTAAEQAEVEQLLAASPAARQLLDELRALSSTLQTMPQYKLGEDISERVLRIAQRRILTEAEQLNKPAKVPQPRVFRRLLNSRALIWSGLAVAVAVMLMVTQPPRPIRVAGDATDKDRADKDRDTEASPITAPGKKSITGKSTGKSTDGGTLSEAGLKRTSRAFSTQPGDGVVEERPAGSKEMPEKFATEKRWGGLGASKQAADVKSAPADPGALSEATAKPGAGGVAKDVGDALSAYLDAEAKGRPVVQGKGADTFAWGDGAVGDGYVVVHCDVSPKAVKNQIFEELLVKNKIVWSRTPDEYQIMADKLAEAKVERRSQSGQQQRQIVNGLLQSLDNTGELALVYVEATPDQINGTLTDLKAQPSEFLSVEVDSVPGEGKKAHRTLYYDRKNVQLEKTDEGGQIRGRQGAPGWAGDSVNVDAATRPRVVAKPKHDIQRQQKVPLGSARRLPVPDGRWHARYRAPTAGLDAAKTGGVPRPEPTRGALNRSTPRAPQPAAEPTLEPSTSTDDTGHSLTLAKPTEVPRPPAGGTKAIPGPGTRPAVPRRDADQSQGVRVPEGDPAEPPPDGFAPAESLAPADEPAKLKGPAKKLAELEVPAEGPALRKKDLSGGRGVQRPGLPRLANDAERGKRSEEPAAEDQPPAVQPAGKGQGAGDLERSAGTGAAVPGEDVQKSQTQDKRQPRPRRELEEAPLPVPTVRALFVMRLVKPDIPAAAASITGRSTGRAAKAAPAADMPATKR